ncbi:MAG TPA: DUF5723 family protein [Gemmatimonadaceae bacterium]|nr:DUF5723 family protein [Gemmatimonadaceae bacterium]
MTRYHVAITRPALVVSLAAAILAPHASAQLVSASAASLALGDNFTALARGYNAVNWNPAGLGMPENPLVSFSFAGRGSAGMDPISMSDFAKYGGVTIPSNVLASWVSRVQAQGGQKLDAEGAGSFAMSIGPFAFQLSTNAYERGKLSADAVETLFYGNAGLTGTPRDMNFKGSRTEAVVTTTAAASFGQSIDIDLGPLTQHFAIGATVKYVVGNALLLGEDAGSRLVANPLGVNVQFPIIQSDTAFSGMPQRGHGVGLDVGAAWEFGPFAAGATIQNLLNTFKWNVNDMYFRPGGAVFSGAATRTTSFDAISMASVPDSLRARADAMAVEVDAMRFTPSLNVGASMQVLPFLTAMADVRQNLGDGMHLAERTHVGAGAELRLIPFLPIRAGLSMISGGYVASAGAGLELAFFRLNAGIAARKTEYGQYPSGAITVSIGQ